MSSYLIPGYDRWLDGPFERDIDARAEAAGSDSEEEVEDESTDEDLWEDYP